MRVVTVDLLFTVASYLFRPVNDEASILSFRCNVYIKAEQDIRQVREGRRQGKEEKGKICRGEVKQSKARLYEEECVSCRGPGTCLPASCVVDGGI